MKNRQIVITRAAIVAAVGLVVALLALFGVGVDNETSGEIVNFLVLAMPIVLPLGAALWQRLDVTPTFDPRDNEGNQLVPSDEDFSLGHGGETDEEYVGKHRV